MSHFLRYWVSRVQVGITGMTHDDEDKLPLCTIRSFELVRIAAFEETNHYSVSGRVRPGQIRSLSVQSSLLQANRLPKWGVSHAYG